MDGIEAVSEVVTGGLPARAVEPHAGEAGADGHTHEKACLNCGTRLIGRYCSACGQKAHVHRSVRAFFQDFLDGAFQFRRQDLAHASNARLVSGPMTRRYIAGERARFISPVALYLFTVFAMFAVLNFTGALSPAKSMKEGLRTEIADDLAS